jgi:hypothetical protein
MKKELSRVWLIYSLAMCILYVGANFLFCKLFGAEFDFIAKSLAGAFLACIMSFMSVAGVYFSTMRTKYLENSDIEKPNFKGISFSTFDTPQDFNCFKGKIAEQWIITFSDDEKKVLKFRERIRHFNCAGAWLMYDADTQRLNVGCFTVTGVQNEIARKMLKEIEKIVADC